MEKPNRPFSYETYVIVGACDAAVVSAFVVASLVVSAFVVSALVVSTFVAAGVVSDCVCFVLSPHPDIRTQAEIRRTAASNFFIDYPDSFITKTTPDNGDGILLASKDGNAELSVSGINNALGDTAASFLKSLTEEHTNASLKTTQDNWVILSWTDGDTVFYQKSVIGTGSIDTFVLKYPKTQEDIYTTIITYLETSFKTPAIEESH